MGLGCRQGEVWVALFWVLRWCIGFVGEFALCVLVSADNVVLWVMMWLIDCLLGMIVPVDCVFWGPLCGLVWLIAVFWVFGELWAWYLVLWFLLLVIVCVLLYKLGARCRWVLLLGGVCMFSFGFAWSLMLFV